MGALTWELLARQAPCHWTAIKDTDCDSIFVFPLHDDWNTTLRNIISFCIQPFGDSRPSHDTIIELLEDELQGVDETRRKGTSRNTDEIDLEIEQGEVIKLKELHILDIEALQNVVSISVLILILSKRETSLLKSVISYATFTLRQLNQLYLTLF